MLKKENISALSARVRVAFLKNVVSAVWKPAAAFTNSNTHLCFSTDVLHHSGQCICVSWTSLTSYLKKID